MLVFVMALSLATLALTRRLNSIDTSRYVLLLTVAKEEVQIPSAIPGTIAKVYVQQGQNVKKGEVLIEMANDALTARLQALQRATNNVSAETEASVLRAQLEQYQVKAPKDGIIYSVEATEGTYLPTTGTVVTMLTNANTKLLASVTSAQYGQIQKQLKLNAFSSRLEQLYKIELEGVSKVLPVDAATNTPRYELAFHFVNLDDGENFIQGENLDLVGRTLEDESYEPAYLIAKFWNSFIIGGANSR